MPSSEPSTRCRTRTSSGRSTSSSKTRRRKGVPSIPMETFRNWNLRSASNRSEANNLGLRYTCLMSGVPQRVLPNASHKTFYLETFGCQMNVHDSEKVIGTLVHEGYRQVQTVEQADLILYNTCSIRDKAEQKVFHRLAHYKKLLAQGKNFGVLSCVAQ